MPNKNDRIICNLNVANDSSKQLEKFWLNEEVPDVNVGTNNECKRHFQENYSRDRLGRFTVSMSFGKDPKLIGESKQQAINRFLALERKFERNNELATEYKKFLNEYVQLDHMLKIDVSNETPSSISYYLPHHCVVKGDSLTT